MQRNLAFSLVGIALLGGGYLLFGGAPELATTGESNLSAAAAFETRSGEVSQTGVLACTPKKSGASIGAGECVMGLKADDGKFYSLDTTGMQNARGENLSRVKVIGTLVATDQGNEEVGDYAYDGVITVRAIEAN